MQRYQQLSKSTYGQELNLPLERETTAKEVDAELSGILLQIIPAEWELSFPAGGGGKESEVIINALNAHLQNQIFLPTVTIDPELVVMRTSARWVSAQEKEKRTSQKENQLRTANEEMTCSSLVTNYDLKEVGSSKEVNRGGSGKSRGLRVEVVLTADRYMHM